MVLRNLEVPDFATRFYLCQFPTLSQCRIEGNCEQQEPSGMETPGTLCQRRLIVRHVFKHIEGEDPGWC